MRVVLCCGDAVTGQSAAPRPHRPSSGAADWRGSAFRAALVSLLLIGALLGISQLQHSVLKLHGTSLTAERAPDFSGLLDTQGRRFSWRAERGRAVLVFFGYTHCPDVCPLTLSALRQSLDRIGPLRRNVRVIFVSLDPIRDTPAVLRAYLDAFIPDAVGLRGSLQDVAQSARQWGISWRRVNATHGDYWIDHTAAVTLVGPRGHLRARYGYGQLADPAWLAADLHAMLARP
ncbi:MAG: SCO family protein [Proteobacteria bacterium]|nr:SCO family protein [Pseudomonadota bacterium]